MEESFRRSNQKLHIVSPFSRPLSKIRRIWGNSEVERVLPKGCQPRSLIRPIVTHPGLAKR
jgi:hypothetical protein